MDVVNSYRADDDWQFSPNREGYTPDTVDGCCYLREIYLAASPKYTGKVTVPVLWDRDEGTIVNNESREILRMLDVAFAEYGNGLTLYPEGYRTEVDRSIDAMFESINSGVYRAGFSETQAAYESAVDDIFEGLDRWDGVLADQRYLAGNRLTEADICLIKTLVRFDQVYHTHFKCDRRRVADYNDLHAYVHELYQLPGVADTVDMNHIKEHFYTTHTSINPSGLIAVGPELTLDEPHDRNRLPGGPPGSLAD